MATSSTIDSRSAWRMTPRDFDDVLDRLAELLATIAERELDSPENGCQ